MSKKDSHEQEAAWDDKARKPANWSWVFWAVGGIVLTMFSGLLLLPGQKLDPGSQTPAVAEGEAGLEADRKVRDGIDAAEKVARVFLAEGIPFERLRRVRDGDDVLFRMDAYSKEAREAPGEIEKMIGHLSEGGRTVTAFAVTMPSGDVRLLEVVETEKGPKVDWDAYARYGTASWEDLLSGKAERAVVRVFCEPSSERPEPFGNQAEWTCFRLSSPDLPQAALGFAQVGSVREVMMKKVIIGTPRYRQRFTLEILRHEGKDEPLFEITRCLAVGWILGDWDVEDDWRAKGE